MSTVADFRKQEVEIVRETPDLASLEILRRVKESGYSGARPRSARLGRLNPTIAELTQAIEPEAEKCPPARRWMTHPGVGALTALARADYRKGRMISVRQVDWMLSGIGAVRGLERRTASAGTHHQAGKSSAALLISGSGGATDEPYDSRMAESVPPLDGAT